MNKFNDFNLDIELNKITTDKYEQLKGDMEFIRNGVYQCYKKPINVDFSKIVNLADPENQYDAVNLRYFDENLNSIKGLIDKLKEKIENIDLNPETSKWCRDVEEKFDQFEALFCTIITLIDEIKDNSGSSESIENIKKIIEKVSELVTENEENIKVINSTLTVFESKFKDIDDKFISVDNKIEKLYAILCVYAAKFKEIDVRLDKLESGSGIVNVDFNVLDGGNSIIRSGVDD